MLTTIISLEDSITNFATDAKYFFFKESITEMEHTASKQRVEGLAKQ